MNKVDTQYLALTDDILHKNGVVQENRTGINAKFIPSGVIVSDLRDGFPLLTTKKLATKANFGEIMGFLQGHTSAGAFRDLGCNIWDANANQNKQWLDSPFRLGEDDMGVVYGATWRNREAIVRVHTDREKQGYINLGYKLIHKTDSSYLMSKDIDQLRDVIDKILHNPSDRRIIMHAWFPELFPQMCLPPCHVMYEFVPDMQNNVLHMTMFQRSCDHLLGVPFNHAGSAFLLKAIATACGYTAGVLSHQMTNVHLYDNQYEAAQIQLDRINDSYSLPNLEFIQPVLENSTDGVLDWLENINHSCYELTNYEHHDPLPKVAMAV